MMCRWHIIGVPRNECNEFWGFPSEPRLTEERSQAEIPSAWRRSDETQVLLPGQGATQNFSKMQVKPSFLLGRCILPPLA